jgi:tRNA-intron endonuclease
MEIIFDKKFTIREPESIQNLRSSNIGVMKNKQLELTVEEALYLMDVRNADCYYKNKKMSFNDVAGFFSKKKKFLARYFSFKDWKDKGLAIKPIETKENFKRSQAVKYPSQEFKLEPIDFNALYFQDDLISIVEEEKSIELYEKNWFGQWGTYKAKKHGRLLKLDAYETLFLSKHVGLKTSEKPENIMKNASKRRKDFQDLYNVYEDLRLRGFVLKTGFKFGTHFRLYFPGANPNLIGEQWMHSRHVIHVFPRTASLLISEWARAIRVAHGVRKTFILAIPGNKNKKTSRLDFLLYHRKKEGVENASEDKPHYSMLALSEEEKLSGEELAKSINAAKTLGLDLILSICDRETSITYYKVKRIDLSKSRYEYYEIEWIQP